MLAVKNRTINKNKLIIYLSLIIIIIAGITIQIFLSYFPSNPDEMDQGIVLFGPAGDAGVQKQDSLSGIATTAPVQLNIYEVGLYSAIVDNPKYKSLKESYLDDLTPIHKGKDNPFAP